MKTVRRVIVFDAADLYAESPFWAAVLDGSQQQQVHIDLHVEDPQAAHDEVIALGATLLQAAPDLGSKEGHQVYADPAGHPFCVGWGHPSPEQLAAYVAEKLGPWPGY